MVEIWKFIHPRVSYSPKALPSGNMIKVITKLPNSEQSYKGKVKTHNYINRQNQSTSGKLHFHIVKMYKDKEVKNVKNFFVNVWRKSIFDIYVTEYGTALTTILPILFLYLNTVTHTLTKKFLTFLTSLSLYIFTIWKCITYNFFCRDRIYFDKILVSEYKVFPVPSQGYYGFHSFPDVDWFCLFI
jgi:hypothetical protein